jgi:hypothetical protein
MKLDPRPAMVAAVLLASAGAAMGDASAPGEAGSLRWRCGGIGADERRALAAASAGASLQVLIVSEKRGSYLTGARLEVYGAGKTAALLSVESAGPLCYVEAPAGEYRVTARLEGVARETRVRVGGPGHAHARAVLAFPEEPWDGIRASEEEKRQAREP